MNFFLSPTVAEGSSSNNLIKLLTSVSKLLYPTQLVMDGHTSDSWLSMYHQGFGTTGIAQILPLQRLHIKGVDSVNVNFIQCKGVILCVTHSL